MLKRSFLRPWVICSHSALKSGFRPLIRCYCSVENESERSHLSNTTFSSIENVSPKIKKAIGDVLKFTNLTHVQEQTLTPILDGKDLLAKAKTGTGKTMAFLIPSINQIIQQRKKAPETAISSLIISPTRELAAQIKEEAQQLLTYCPEISTALLVGGKSKLRDEERLKLPIDILVATPGRLIDHLRTNSKLTKRLSYLRNLTLDEADTLLDMGFRDNLKEIILSLPRERQTLMFSATVPKSVEKLISSTLRKNYEYVDTVGDEEPTHTRVNQQFMVCPIDKQIQMLDICIAKHKEECKERNEHYKILVFFPTANGAAYMCKLFEKSGINVVEMHSRMTQAARGRASAKFQSENDIIMFSSDVSARGMDYRDVSYVIQIGHTEKEQYIHRLGRTARVGKKGQGMLILSPFETGTVQPLKDLNLKRVSHETVNVLSSEPMRNSLSETLGQVHKDKVLSTAAKKAHTAFLGYYTRKILTLGGTKYDLVDYSYELAKAYGLKEKPVLASSMAIKMGFKNVYSLLRN